MKRRLRAVLLVLGGILVLLCAQNASAEDTSTFSTSDDPLLNGPTLPSFKFDLNKQKVRTYEGGTAKEAGVADFPVSRGLAGVDMYLKPGGLRELHWHANAAEWAYVIKGHCRVTVIDPQGRSEVADFGPGDVWYFPRGHGHSIQGIGNEECHFILVFDNGRFSEFSTFSASDWMSKVPPAVLAKNFGTTADTFANFPRKEVYIAQGKPPEPLPADPGFRSQNSPPLTHRYHLASQEGLTFTGGTFQLVSQKQFPISTTMTGALQTLQGGALRELHWHPNANEWQYYISGHAHLSVFGANGRVRVEDMGPGDVGYVPRGFGHYIENASDKEPCQTLIVLDSGDYQEISLSDWIRSQPLNVLEANFGVTKAVLDKLERKQGFIAAP